MHRSQQTEIKSHNFLLALKHPNGFSKRYSKEQGKQMINIEGTWGKIFTRKSFNDTKFQNWLSFLSTDIQAPHPDCLRLVRRPEESEPHVIPRTLGEQRERGVIHVFGLHYQTVRGVARTSAI